jgi:aminoglycoside phosphotransferase (APT) family kinase protein
MVSKVEDGRPWFDVDILLGQASQLRQGITCQLTGDRFRGCSNTIYVLRFGDGVKWAARILRNPDASQLVREGTSTLKYIKTCSPQLKVPSIHAEFLDPDDPTGLPPHVFMEWIEGTPLQVWSHYTIDEQKRQTLLEDLAKFLLTLWSLPISLPRISSHST